VQIPQYPKLTQIGAWRPGSELDGNPNDISHKRYGGFYTDAQIQQIVAYARRRYVTIVPEIDIPGHCTAALAAYPWLAAAKGPFHVRIRWGVSNVPLSPARRTFRFLDAVFGYLTRLFPGHYIHLGGDEVSRRALQVWAHNPIAARLMRQRHWTVERLHDYFPAKMAQYLAAKGRRAVVWDDVPAKNLPHNTIIECWNSSSIVTKDASLGHDVIVAECNRLYLNYCQGDPRFEPHAIVPAITIRQVYHFNPSALLPKALRSRLLGIEACLWSERIATARHLFYQALPREMAFAEIAWTPLKKQYYRGFVHRTSRQYLWLSTAHYNFRMPPPSIRCRGGRATLTRVPERNLVVCHTASNHEMVQMMEPVPGAAIYYTRSGAIPTVHALRYRKPFAILVGTGKRQLISSIAITPSGASSAPSRMMVECNGH
jgi:hexosaminidase